LPISFEEQNLQSFEPDKLLHVLDDTQMEHRLLAAGNLEAHLQRLVVGDLIISTGDYRFPVCIRGGAPHDKAFIGFYWSIPGEVRENYHAISLDHLLLYAPGTEAYVTTRGSVGWGMLILPIKRLQETAIALHGVDLEWPRQGIRYLDLPSLLARHLRQEVSSLLKLGQNLDTLFDNGLTESLVCSGLIQLLVHAIVNGTQSSRPQLKLSDCRRRALVAMETCISRWKSNPVNDLRVAEIKGTSERILQLASREIYGVTPHRWLMIARLNAAYHDLLGGRCMSVTEACGRWKFNHPGHFARDYRNVFGESPRETLQRARA